MLAIWRSCCLVEAETFEMKERFKVTFSRTEGLAEQFIMNMKELDDGFIALKYQLEGGNEIVKFNSLGEELYSKAFDSDVMLSDVIQTSSGKLLVVANEQKVFIYDPDSDEYSSISSDFVGHPSGHSIFEFNGNYIVVGAIKAKSNDTEYTIVLQLLDENGLEITNSKIVQSVHPKCQAYTNDGAGVSGTLCGSYYGAYSDGEVLYLLTSDGEEIVLLEVKKDLTYKKNVLKSELTEDELLQITRGVYTELARDGEDTYFATTYGIYKIDGANNLTQPIVASANNLDFTSIIIENDYIVTGGIEKSEEFPRAWVTVYDKDFMVVKSINIHDYFEIESGVNLSIVKGLTDTRNGFMVGGMLSSTPIAMEFSTQNKVMVKTDGNGEILSSVSMAYVDENIEFTILPNDGYELSEVRVVDVNGNEISVVDYKFEMPNTDVIISANFAKIEEEVVENPATNDLFIFVIVIIGVSMYVMLRNYKKIN